MRVEFHPDAAARFNERGRQLVGRIAPCAVESDRESSFEPDLFVTGRIEAADVISDVSGCIVDGTGTEIGRFFHEDGATLGLTEAAHTEFADLVRSMRRTGGLAARVTDDRLRELVFDWLKAFRTGSIEATLSDYATNQLACEIQKFEMYIPIARLSIQSPLRVGRVELRPIRRELLDSWIADLTRGSPAADAELFAKRWRPKMQGFAAAFLRVEAEHSRAKEIALEEAEVATSLLRFFSGASLSPKMRCYCTTLGKEHVRRSVTLALVDGTLSRWTHSNLDPGGEIWALSANELSNMRSAGLDALSEIYCRPTSEFHRKIVDAVLLYARVSLTLELAEKLVLVLAALESLFLKTDTEAIQQNLGERLAILVGKTLEEKRDIVATTKGIYRLRSRFLHHAGEVEDIDSLARFMVFAWRGILTVLSNRDRFTTLDQFLSAIDERKLS